MAEPGQDFSEDLARVAAAREALGDDGFLRIDVNGAWRVDEAESRLRSLEKFDLQYVEQPCATLKELAELRSRIPFPSPPTSRFERAYRQSRFSNPGERTCW